MAGHLLLGPVLFRDYELPERINWGGEQRLAVHRLPGGRRIIDAMGRDDAPIQWSGVFSGEDGAMRARLLDLMRAEGRVWPLNWGSFLYSVMISAFTVQYERAQWLPYRIVCTVLRDEMAAVAEDAMSLASSVLSDLSLAAGAGSGLDLIGVQAAFDLDGAVTLGTPAYAAALTAVAGVAASAEQDLAGADASVARASVDDSASLGGAAQAAGELARALQTRGYAARAATLLRTAQS